MMRNGTLVAAAWTLLLGGLAGAHLLAADDPAESKPAETAKPEPGQSDPLAIQQQQLGDKFRRLEEVLLRMAELTGSSDPRRAALLKKAVAQSKEQLIGVQFDAIVELLKKDQLSKASEGQVQVNQDLQALLELLQSENRARRLESEKARIREYLKQLNQILKQQQGVQGRTAGAGDPKDLAKEQGKLAQKTGDLAKDIRRNEENGAPKEPGKDQQGEGKPGEPSGPPEGSQGKPDAQGKPGKDQAKPGKDQAKPGQDGQKPGEKDQPSAKPDGQGQPSGEGQQSQEQQGQGQQSQGQQSQGQPNQGQQGQQGQPQSDPQQTPSENPARKRLENAQQRMREAEKKLEEAQRQGAAEKQEEAIRELQEAKAELEKILRQLREEEMERVLTMLEARFAKMLKMQQEVLEGTIRLDKVPQADRSHNHEIESGRLSSKEAEIVLDADKALALLREDGTALAFPEALEQARTDMEQVVQRLAQFKVNEITQGIEQDIISALEEMLAALKKALQDQQNRRSQDQPQGEPQDPSLVDALSEIKMIRALQMRVNLRTARYSKMIEGEQAEKAELVEAIRNLAERQLRVYEVTRDLHMGRNR